MVFDYVFNDHDTNLSYLHTVFVYGICLDTHSRKHNRTSNSTKTTMCFSITRIILKALWLPLTLQASKKGLPQQK